MTAVLHVQHKVELLGVGADDEVSGHGIPLDVVHQIRRLRLGPQHVHEGRPRPRLVSRARKSGVAGVGAHGPVKTRRHVQGPIATGSAVAAPALTTARLSCLGLSSLCHSVLPVVWEEKDTVGHSQTLKGGVTVHVPFREPPRTHPPRSR